MMIRVKKVVGRSVRMPEFGYKFMPETDVSVPENQYYLRRLEQGDIERVKTSKRKAPKVPTTKPKEETGMKNGN